MDNDGDLDLTVNGDQAALLYINANGEFDPSAAWASDERSGGAAAWGDVDGDGARDLLAGGVLFHNQLGRRLAVAGAPRLVVQTPRLLATASTRRRCWPARRSPSATPSARAWPARRWMCGVSTR
ncbi:MAG: VCBS repeat-containing protein [Anaerolineae bacterium]